jgi:hypothetical protein
MQHLFKIQYSGNSLICCGESIEQVHDENNSWTELCSVGRYLGTQDLGLIKLE